MVLKQTLLDWCENRTISLCGRLIFGPQLAMITLEDGIAMPVEALARSKETEQTFPAAEVKQRLRRELEQTADDAAIVRGSWEPLLDSLVVVAVVIVLDDLFDFPLPPDELIRPGGYSSVDEAVSDISERVRSRWLKRKNRRTGS